MEPDQTCRDLVDEVATLRQELGEVRDDYDEAVDVAASAIALLLQIGRHGLPKTRQEELWLEAQELTARAAALPRPAGHRGEPA